jgi:hypothetical protein
MSILLGNMASSSFFHANYEYSIQFPFFDKWFSLISIKYIHDVYDIVSVYDSAMCQLKKYRL